jgi:hypothetical protein
MSTRDGDRSQPGASPVPETRNAPGKQTYRPPSLVRYGDLVDLTRASNAGTGTFDGEVVATMGKIVLLKSF